MKRRKIHIKENLRVKTVFMEEIYLLKQYQLKRLMKLLDMWQF